MLPVAGQQRSHVLIALGHAAVYAGLPVLYLTAAELGKRTFSGLADNTVGKAIDAPAAARLRHQRRTRIRPARPGRYPAAVPIRRSRLRTPPNHARVTPPVRGLASWPSRPRSSSITDPVIQDSFPYLQYSAIVGACP